MRWVARSRNECLVSAPIRPVSSMSAQSAVPRFEYHRTTTQRVSGLGQFTGVFRYVRLVQTRAGPLCDSALGQGFENFMASNRTSCVEQYGPSKPQIGTCLAFRLQRSRPTVPLLGVTSRDALVKPRRQQVASVADTVPGSPDAATGRCRRAKQRGSAQRSGCRCRRISKTWRVKGFVYPVGTIAPLINACVSQGIAIEVLKSEQGAGFAAIGYAQALGQIAVALVTSGPGVTNAIAPLADAHYDSTPGLFVMGQVGRGDLDSRPNVRQRGFQEVPTIEICLPISKVVPQPLDATEVVVSVRTALMSMTSGQPGPAFFDFPMNLQQVPLPHTPTPEVVGPPSDQSAIVEASQLSAVGQVFAIGTVGKRGVAIVRSPILLNQAVKAARFASLNKAAVVQPYIISQHFNAHVAAVSGCIKWSAFAQEVNMFGQMMQFRVPSRHLSSYRLNKKFAKFCIRSQKLLFEKVA